MNIRQLTADWYVACAPHFSFAWAMESCRVMKRNIIPALGDKLAAELTTRDVALFSRTLKPGIRRNSLVVLRSSYNWGIEEGLLDANPCLLLRTKSARRRDRFLSDDELRRVWHACEGMQDFTLIFRLLVLTGCRRAEIGSLKGSEVKWGERRLELPAGRTKNRAPRIVPLTPAALDLIPKGRGSSPLFGQGFDGFSGWGKCVDVVRARVKGMPHWTLHDLRRTVRTGLARLKVQPHISELCIGHSKRGVIAIYDQHLYLEEQRAAMEAWAAEVARIVAS